MEFRTLATTAFVLSTAACINGSSRLEIAVEGDGTTNPTPGSYSYESGTTVKVSAAPANGATFTGWTGAVTGSANPASVAVEGVQTTLVAHFTGVSDGGSDGSNSSGADGSFDAGGGGADGGAGGAGDGGAGRDTDGGKGDAGGGTGGDAGGTLIAPCDIYQSGNTPCVAAHSTVRALYGAYSGKLYQVRRADNTTKDISVLTEGGFADSASQETFCAGTKCVISIVYDQSPKHNDLTKTSGGWIGNNAKEADAAGIKITVGGHTVYGIHVPNGVGYRNNSTSGVAKGDDPEGMYMVVNGKNYNGGCCFDYGNAEANSLDNGNGTMEAIYFGNSRSWGSGEGNGPWVMADLENGLFSGQGAATNAADKSMTSAYVTGMVKGKAHTWAIEAGDSQSGSLTTMYEGARPNNGYDPMKKEGAIILGTGGDNSNGAVGDFFEGAMTSGYPAKEADDAVQANIVAAGYGH